MIKKSSSDIIEIGEGTNNAKIHMVGATVIAWTAYNEPQLYLSSRAHLDGSKPIRGGIPLVFPQFGPPTNRSYNLPQHGFARTLRWQCVGQTVHEATLECKSSDAPETTCEFPFAFTLRLVVSVGEGWLKQVASVVNTSAESFAIDWLFHTYLLVSDVHTVSVPGLVESFQSFEEVETRYANVPQSIQLIDGKRRVRIDREGVPDVVVWNPGSEKASKMADMGVGEERVFVCVEAGAIDPPGAVIVLPAGTCKFAQTLSVEY